MRRIGPTSGLPFVTLVLQVHLGKISDQEALRLAHAEVADADPAGLCLSVAAIAFAHFSNGQTRTRA